MDVKKTSKKSARSWHFDGKSKNLMVLTAVVLVALVTYGKSAFDGVSVQRSDILVSTVKKGDLDVVIDGYGTLVSDKQQLITAATTATVKDILLKPGAVVSAESIIVTLENPELVQQVQNDKQELALIQANLRQLKLNHKREILEEKAKAAELSTRHQSAVLKRDAEQALALNGIVSKLTFQESVLNEQQLKQQVKWQNLRLAQLAEVHTEAVNIELERIKQYQGRLAVSQNRLNKLEVRAGFDGVLQRLSVELGQNLAAGEEIALIGSANDLVAMIKVPQTQAQQVNPGQSAVINTRSDKIIGTVSRVDPVVVENTVNIEIALPEQLPDSARPQLNVDGTIIIETLSGVNYIERPANIKSNAERQLYQLDDSAAHAQLKTIRFGQVAGRFIEIVSGARPNQRLIISDLSQLQTKTDALTIKL